MLKYFKSKFIVTNKNAKLQNVRYSRARFSVIELIKYSAPYPCRFKEWAQYMCNFTECSVLAGLFADHQWNMINSFELEGHIDLVF